MTFSFCTAQPAHREVLEHLLSANRLPISDLPHDLGMFTLAFDGEALAGSAGVQVLGSCALLRSVAVYDAYRSHGLGRQLVEAALTTARDVGVREVWLITDSADRYFETFGFERVPRDAAPPDIAETPQFAGLCPGSAVVMKLLVTNG